MCNQQRLRPAAHSLIRAFASRLNIRRLLNYLEFLSIKGGCTGLSESTLVKMCQKVLLWSKGLNCQPLTSADVVCCKFSLKQLINIKYGLR